MAHPHEHSARPRPGPVREALEGRIAKGEIDADPLQRRLADSLDALDRTLSTRAVASKKSALGWLFGKTQKAETIAGLYIHGGVGRGKTMLMDMFFRKASVRAKRRAHFHAFMGDVHERIALHRRKVKEGSAEGDDPIPPVAREIADEARLLCFDEFAVTDVADAMILSRLFKALFGHGVVLVATSNVAPDDLYKDGLNRGLFTPFIEVLKAHTTIFPFEGGEDYRMEAAEAEQFYLTPLGKETAERVEAIWTRLVGEGEEGPETVRVNGRQVEFERASGEALRTSYSDLLKRPLGAQDYLALAKRFRTVVVEDVPVMDESERNEARRFIALVDALYDTGRHLVVSAEASADELYVGRGGKEAFEFQRTASRLHEMRSREYLENAAASAGERDAITGAGRDGATGGGQAGRKAVAKA